VRGAKVTEEDESGARQPSSNDEGRDERSEHLQPLNEVAAFE
jgi:hypothetical protein